MPVTEAKYTKYSCSNAKQMEWCIKISQAVTVCCGCLEKCGCSTTYVTLH